MNKKRTIIIVLLVLFASIFYFSTQRPDDRVRQKISINKKTIEVEIAKTLQQKTQGLSGRKFLDKNSGMLFVYDEPQTIGIWMKNMNFALDIIWIDENNTVVAIEENVIPKTYPKTFQPKMPAKYVLEVSAGFVKDNDIRINNSVHFK